jgi:tetratricopeptide (TPR) repeat protein
MDTTEEVVSFDERVEILAKELELAVKWQRPCILLVVYSSEYVRSDVEAALENSLIDLGQKVVRMRLKDQRTESVVSFLREFKDPAEAVFMVHGLHWADREEADTYSMLNLQREFFVERQIRSVFWLTQNEIVNLARCAPDFWAYRHRVIEFTESPKAERLLQEALESAWQGTGEYADQFEDTDAKISLRESLLTELPEGEEATSVRANLLLTLSILNWRKGDFERAGEQLNEALKASSRVQDNWFEAECHNALALIKSSTGHMDEAIDAYKQAIHLAPDQIFAWNNLGNLCARIGRNDEAMFAFRKAIECNPKDPIAWNGLADLYVNIGYVDDAIAAYRKAIQYLPSLAQPWNGLGDVYASMGRTDEAMKAYHKSIELNKSYITPWIGLGLLFTKQDRYREAARAYQRALDLDPRSSSIWNDLGKVYLKSEALDEAADAFSKAIDLDRGYGWAYSNLAYTYTLQGKCKPAVSLLLRSIELLHADKDKAVSWNRLASVYRLLNDYEDAIAAYQMADKLDLTGAASRHLEATMIEQNADALEAEKPVEPAQEVIEVPDAQLQAEPVAEAAPVEQPISSTEPEKTEPEEAKVSIEEDALAKTQPVRAVSKSETKAEQPAPASVQDAPAWLFASDAVEPEAPEPVAEIAAVPDQPIRAQAAPVVEAVSEPKPVETPAEQPAARAQEPGTRAINPEALKWNDDGNACFSRGALNDAINAYNKAIQLDPAFGVPYSNLGLTYLNQGHFAEAVLLYKKSIELLQSDTEKAVCWNALGNAYRCLKDYRNAVSAYQKAAQLDAGTAGIRDRAEEFEADERPRDAQGWNALGELFAKTGSANEAINAFRRAIEMEPRSGKAYGNLARTLVAQNRYHEAIPLYQKSIDLLQDNKEKAAAWNRLGNVYRKLNDYDNAIKAYQKAVALADEGVDLLTRTRFSLLSNCYVNP